MCVYFLFYFYPNLAEGDLSKKIVKNAELGWILIRRRTKNLKNVLKGPEVNLFGSLNKIIAALHQNFTAASLNCFALINSASSNNNKEICGSKGTLVPNVLVPKGLNSLLLNPTTVILYTVNYVHNGLHHLMSCLLYTSDAADE